MASTPTPERHHHHQDANNNSRQRYNSQTPSPGGHSSYAASSGGGDTSQQQQQQHVIVGPREQLVALRRNLPTHTELLRVCEQFPEEGERLSAYVAEVERKIEELEHNRREHQRAVDRHRHDVARETAHEIEKQKVHEAEEKFLKRQTAAEANQRKQQRERDRQLQEKHLLEQSTAEHMERYRRMKQQEQEEEVAHKLEHWSEAIVHAKQARGKIQMSLKERKEQEHREWQQRVAQSRARQDERINERVADVAERNARLSNMAQHKHDLAMQARLRRETGKEERSQMVRAAVRRKEAASMAAILNRIEESELKHEQIVAEQRQRRKQRIAALRHDRAMHRQMAQERQSRIKEEQEEKRHDFEERSRRELARHLQHHADIRAEMERRIHETNERRHRAHHVVVEHRKAELDEAARKVVARAAKVATALGVMPPGSSSPGDNSVLDEEVRRSMSSDNSFKVNWEHTSRQRMYLNNQEGDDDDEDEEEQRRRRNDPRAMPAIMRTQHLSPKKAPGGKSLEFILDTAPKKQQGANLKLIADSGKSPGGTSPATAAKKKKEEEDKKKQQQQQQQKEEEEKKKKEAEEAAKQKKAAADEAEAKKKKEQQQQEEEQERQKKAQEQAAAEKEKEQQQQQQQQQQQKQDDADDNKPVSARHSLPEAEATAAKTAGSSSSSSVNARVRSLFIGCSYAGVDFGTSSTDTNTLKQQLINKSSASSAAAVTGMMATMQNLLGADDCRHRQVLVDGNELAVGKTGAPTWRGITDALGAMVQETRPGDSLIVMYAGADEIAATTTTTSPSAANLCGIVPCDAPAKILSSGNDSKDKDKQDEEVVITADVLDSFVKKLPAGSRFVLISSTPSGSAMLPPAATTTQWNWSDEKVRFIPSSSNNNNGEGQQQQQKYNTDVISISAAPVAASASASAAQVMTVSDALASAWSTKPAMRFDEMLARVRNSLMNADEKAVVFAGTSDAKTVQDVDFSFLAPEQQQNKQQQQQQPMVAKAIDDNVAAAPAPAPGAEDDEL